MKEFIDDETQASVERLIKGNARCRHLKKFTCKGTLHGRCLSEPVFVNPLRSPGIDSQPGGPVRQSYLTYRPAWLHRLAV
jgi:hypothetical protein